MGLIFFRYWLRRLVLMFVTAMAILVGVNSRTQGYSPEVLMNSWQWALVVGFSASSLSTALAYWRVRKHRQQQRQGQD